MKYSATGDGISDLAKIQAGLDPLDGRGFPTGVIANLPLQGQANAIDVVGSTLNATQQTAFVATGSYGLAIVNASQFTKPIVLGQIRLPGDAVDVSVDPRLNIAAVATGIGGLQLVDIADPTNPILLQTINVTVSQVKVINGVVYAAVNGELRAYDLLTGEKIQSLSISGNTITGLAREGSILYTMDSGNVLRAVDISGFQMVARGSVALPHGGGKLFVGNGIAYVPTNSANGGFVTVNVSNAASPLLISDSQVPAGTSVAGVALAVNGSGIAVVTGNASGFQGANKAVDLFDVSNPSNTYNFLTRIDLPDTSFDLAIAAGLAFIADGTGGLQVVNYLSFDNQGVAPTVSISTSATDVDPSSPGLQLVEGSTIPITANVLDDVQVRNVELLVNGTVVENAVSFPFNLIAILPTLASLTEPML